MVVLISFKRLLKSNVSVKNMQHIYCSVHTLFYLISSQYIRLGICARANFREIETRENDESGMANPREMKDPGSQRGSSLNTRE